MVIKKSDNKMSHYVYCINVTKTKIKFMYDADMHNPLL
jgi:hypothetical protein